MLHSVTSGFSVSSSSSSSLRCKLRFALALALAAVFALALGHGLSRRPSRVPYHTGDKMTPFGTIFRAHYLQAMGGTLKLSSLSKKTALKLVREGMLSCAVVHGLFFCCQLSPAIHQRRGAVLTLAYTTPTACLWRATCRRHSIGRMTTAPPCRLCWSTSTTTRSSATAR